MDIITSAEGHVHPTAVIDRSAKIHPSVSIGAYCVIGPNVTLGEGCRLGACGYKTKRVFW